MKSMQVADKGCFLATAILVLVVAADGGYSSGCGDAEVCTETEAMLSTDVTAGSLVQARSHSIKVVEEVNATRKQECMPHFECNGEWSGRCDTGHDDNFRGWYDVQGCGTCNDYCRWVGGPGSGGDPAEQQTEHLNSFWSCRLAGGTTPYTPRGTYQSWSLPKCAGSGASPPQVATPYVPGQPGAAWTTEEMLAVRAKIHRVIAEGDMTMRELTGNWSLSGALQNPAATMLRLGFHDCLKYADNTGGCDGCLEWKGVGDRFTNEDLGFGLLPADVTGDGHNNGLGNVVRVLERIYTQPDFPSRTPNMALPLQQSGKSRADLWAFATLVAVDYSLDLNNRVCADPEPHMSWPVGQCHPRQDLDDCAVTAPRALMFEIGRRDCVGDMPGEQGYATTKEERHPNPETNGRGTVDFFSQDFGFNGRETVAIMGAHTLGHLTVHQSLFRYTWKTNSGKLLNNGYYRNMARRHDWYFPSDHNKVACKHVGNDKGERPSARWMPHVRGDTEVGGPVQWIQEKLICNSWNISSIQVDTCPETDLEWKFVVGIDETMLPCEMGFYLDFDVDSNGIPSGCPGFENFNPEGWGGDDMFNSSWGGIKNWWNRWTLIDGQRAEPQCPFQTLAEPPEDEPLHEIVESFADSTERWLEVFFPTLEKMIANGYADGELQAAPAEGMSSFSCPHFTADDIRHGRSVYTCT